MNKISLRALRYAVAAAQERSISAAAERLHVSPASISTAITDLEAQLDIQLFVRLPARGTVLTVAGELLVTEARALLAHADEFQTIAGALGHSVQGELRVACFKNLAPLYFANLLAEFCRRYPDVSVTIYVGDQEDLLSGVRSGLFELALTFDLNLTDQFDWLMLAKIPPRVVLSWEHPFAVREEISLGEVASEPLILMDLPHTQEYFLSLFYAANLTPNIRFRSSSFETVRALVGNGLGYSLLNLIPHANTTYDGSRVRHVPLREDLRPLEVGCLSLKRVAKRRVVTAFMDFTREYFAGISLDPPTNQLSGRAVR